jgi:serine/threonine-protein kinase
MHALVRDEGDRFQSAEEFGVALAQAAAFTWGPDWMTESGTVVTGSRAIEVAARTTDRRSFSQAGTVADGTSETVSDVGPSTPAGTIAEPTPGLPAGAAGTIAEPAVPPEAPSTVAESPPDMPPPTIAPPGEVAGPGGPAVDDRGTVGGDFFPSDPTGAIPGPGTAAPVYQQVPTAAVVPQQPQRPQGANLNQLGPADIFNLREIRLPGTPVAFAIAAAVVLLLAVGTAWLGRGDDPAAVAADAVFVDGRSVVEDEPIELDLTGPVSFVGPVDELSATFLGIPIGAPTIEDGELDPSYLRFSGAGVIEFTGDTSDGREIRFPVRASNSPYPTAPFVATAMLGLGGLASVQANLRGLRARRFRLSPYIGLLVSGALSGAAGAVAGMLLLETPASRSAVITAALLAAIGCASLGEAYRRWYRRRRLKRIAVARGRR